MNYRIIDKFVFILIIICICLCSRPRHATMSVTPLSRILQSFSAPISEEHGWAIIHQACVTLIQASSAPVLVVESPSQLLISDDGCIDQDSFTRPSGARRRMTSYAQVVAELGVVVYTALDFSLDEEEQRSLSSGLEHLIDMMTSADSDQDNTQDLVDEGIGQEEERGKEVLERVLELCRHHLAVSEEAGPHYRGVVRALVAESREIRQFMSRLDQDQLAELDRDDWGQIWTNVMQQLRVGVKLKKVDYSKTPDEFSLTPYEMLMDDIRGKKYQLNPVKVSLKVQQDAREVILDFIRSRPPLKAASSRKIAQRQIQLTPQEELMNQIRGDGAKSNLKKTSTTEINTRESEGLKLGKVISKSSSNISLKKVIDLDKSFAENILNFDDCGEQNDEEEDVVQESHQKKNLYLENNPDININTTTSIQETVCSKTTNPRNNPASKQVVNNTPADTGVKSKYSDWIKNLHTLDLSLAEVAHIRSVLTRAELEEMDLAPDRRREYERGRVCFLCGVTRFGLFTWAVQCGLCRRHVCSTCCGKISLPSDKLQDILVCSLTTQLSKEERPESPEVSFRTKKGQNNISNFSRGFERHSFRATARSATREMPSESAVTSRPRLARAKSMDKSMVEAVRAMRLTGTRTGIQHNMCRDCKDMLTSIIRAQRMAAKLDRMRGGFSRRLGHNIDSMRE